MSPICIDTAGGATVATIAIAGIATAASDRNMDPACPAYDPEVDIGTAAITTSIAALK